MQSLLAKTKKIGESIPKMSLLFMGSNISSQAQNLISTIWIVAT